MWGFEVVIIFVMVSVNSVFAAYEIALASVSVTRLERLVHENHYSAKVALYMKQNMEASLAVVQLGITLVGATAAAVGGAGAEELLSPKISDLFGVKMETAKGLAIVFVVVPLSFVTIIVGELIPKVFALRNAEKVCLSLSPFMRWFSFTVYPAVWLFEKIVIAIMSWGEKKMKSGESTTKHATELQEILSTAALARATRLIGHREEKIIHGATEISSRKVKEIMLPAEDMSSLDANLSLMENLIAAHLDMHTRFPVVERANDPQSVIGYVNVKDIIASMRLNPEEPTLKGIIRAIPSLRGEQTVAECLELLMQSHTHISVVRGEKGEVIGLVTLEDILQVLVGKIEDEYDKLPAHVSQSGAAWVVGGGLQLNRLQEVTGINLLKEGELAENMTLADWIERHLQREVRGGDVVQLNKVRLVVRKIRRKKLQEAYLSAVV